MNRLLQIILFSLFAAFAAHSTTVVVPSVLVQNYSVDDYNASCQNWDIAASYFGTLYVANSSGLLTFDGNSWQIYPLPDKSEIKQVTCENDTVYTSGEKSLGYWIKNQFGDMVYTPLDHLPSHIDFKKKETHYPIPEIISKDRPTSFATAGPYNFTGTETNGLYVTNNEGDILLHLSLRNQLSDNIIHSICVQDESLIWLALDNGISQIDINPPLTMLGKRSTTGKIENAILRNDSLYVLTNQGYFKRSLIADDHFIPIPEAIGRLFVKPDTIYHQYTIGQIFKNADEFGSFDQVDGIYPAPDNLYWLTAENEAGLFHRAEDSIGTLECRIMFDNYSMNLITSGKQIISLNSALDLASTMQGAVLVNTHSLITSEIGGLTSPRFQKIEFIDKGGIHQLHPDTQSISLPHRFQKIDLYVGTTIFTPNHQISYMLEGVSSDWSPWQKGGKISFLQLPEGKYELKIRKYVVKGSFPEISLQIEVRPAWYNTIWAYMIYVFLILLIGREALHYHLRSLRREEQDRLEAERQLEEQRMQKMKSEMLETELQNKNNELTLQTSALVKRNQAIQSFLEELDKQKETLGDRYPNKLYSKLRLLMEEALNDQADWLQFETYFNSAHHNFMERLRQQYSDITTGDLRICCLLRMNLSTKEIASLMNVSIRAIELRRYRLRKRLGLDGDTNLVDFLIDF